MRTRLNEEARALAALTEAVGTIGDAMSLTNNGLASDHCANAQGELRKAMTMLLADVTEMVAPADGE